MDTSTILSRLQFAFTISFHYLFPQLTMGLALLILILKMLYLRTGNERYRTGAGKPPCFNRGMRAPFLLGHDGCGAKNT